MFCRVIWRSKSGQHEVITRWNGVIQRLRSRVILELIREGKSLLLIVLSLLLYCKGVYSEFKNTNSARCSSECSNIGFLTNLFSSSKSLQEAIFGPFLVQSGQP